MAILRKNKKAQYTVIDNAIFHNYDLSLKAKGLLCQMLSLPDGWEFSVEGLSKLSTDGRSAVTSALNELCEAGYFRREQVRNGGKIAGVEYVISEVPFAENLIAENLISENPQQLNTKEINKTKKIKEVYRFTPPTVEEVEAYINAKGYRVDAHKFVDYYDSNGWRVGKNPMKNWQAAVRNWARNDYSNGKTSSTGNPWMDMLQKGEY